MRSRYTAYCIGNSEYLAETTYKDTRHLFSQAEIKKWSKENQWKKLEIMSSSNGNLQDTTGVVEFKAYYTDMRGILHAHHERSNFKKDENRWFYVDGIQNPPTLSDAIARNATCPCGSGKKFKKCCGAK